MIIDCHTHWGMCWEEQEGKDLDKWLGVIDKHGIDKVVLMPHAGIICMEKCCDDNDSIAKFAKKYSDKIIPIGTAWPQAEEKGLKETERCIKELGMRGLKFHPWLQGFSTADPVFYKMCKMAGKHNVPVFFHDGTPCYSLPEQIAGLARRLPETTFVLGHSGILWSWRSAVEAGKHKNIWQCLCGPHMRAMEIICQRTDPERILWGSDYGFGFSDPITYRLKLIRSAKIDDDLRARILGENPLRLLKTG